MDQPRYLYVTVRFDWSKLTPEEQEIADRFLSALNRIAGIINIRAKPIPAADLYLRAAEMNAEAFVASTKRGGE